jgi:tripartite ATP-independent transporter DctM subunit
MPIKKIDETIGKIEGALLTGLLVVMIGFSFYQVFARNLHFIPFIKPIVWADALVRHLVLWVGFIGASVATQEDGHLAMDLVSRFLPKKIKSSTSFLVQGAAAFVCILLTVAAYKFFQGERDANDVLIPSISLSWLLEAIPTVLLLGSFPFLKNFRLRIWGILVWLFLTFVAYGVVTSLKIVRHFDIATSWAVLIIPIGFYIMSVRFARKAWVGLGILVALVLPFIAIGAGSDTSWFHPFSQKLIDFGDHLPSSGPIFIALAVGVGVIGLLGAPLFIIFGSISLLAFHSSGTDSSATIIEMYRLASAPTLIAIPLFTFAGYLMAESKTPERLVALAKPLFGWMPGGLALMAIVACAFFTAFTGASGVTIIALGGLLYPILLKEKYPDNFSMGLVTTCGSVGLMFPPSLPLILFGLISGASIDKLFLSGLLPGVLIIAILGTYSIIVNRKVKLERHPFSLKELGTALKGAGWELPLPILVLVGIYGGYFTASEAAAVTAFYVFIIEVFIYKDLSLTKDVPRIAKQSMVLVGSIVVIFAVAMGFTSYLIDEQVPMKLFEWIRHYITSRWVFLLVLNVFLLIVGSLMDIFSAIIVVVPLILPIAKEFAIDPLHLGIIFLTNLEIGYLHPPVGLNLFLSSIRFKRSIVNLYWVTLPFLLLLILALIIITYVPDLSLWLVHHMPGSVVPSIPK